MFIHIHSCDLGEISATNQASTAPTDHDGPSFFHHGGAMLPATQLESWDQIQESISEKRLKVLDVIRRSENGATLFEIVEEIGWPVNRVSGRVTELRKMELIEPSGRRINPESGAAGTVWRASSNIRAA